MRVTTWLVAALLVACGDKGKDSGELSPDLKMGDENSYAYTGEMTIGSVAVAAQVDASVDWCALTTDIRGRPVVPELIDRVLMVEIAATPDEVVHMIETNTLSQEDTVSQFFFMNEEAARCTANLSEFEIIGNSFRVDDFVPSENTWLMTVTYYEAGVFDFVMPQFVVPSAGEPNDVVGFLDSTSSLAFDADLHSLEPMRTSADFDAWTFDWSAVTKDVYGNPYDDEVGNRVLVGHVPFDDIADLEAVFLRLDDEADALYRLDQVDGVPVVMGETDADLMLATDASGAAFPGFTTDGIWLVGVECSTCTSPAPLLLGVVEVE